MAKKSRKKLTRTARENVRGWMFVSLWVIGFLIFTIYPIFSTIQMSFNKVINSANGLRMELVGFKNYMDAFLAELITLLKLI